MIEPIERAIQALARLQQPSGQWLALWSADREMDQTLSYPTSPYVTGFVVHSLAFLKAHPTIPALLDRAQQFLCAIQSDDGSWNYEGPTGTQIPNDLDDTSVASAALLLCGQRPRLETYQRLWENEVEPSGPYYTWIGVNQANSGFARELDVLVNANIAWFAGLAGLKLPALVEYLQRSVADSVYGGDHHGRYFLSPHLAVYTLGRAAADGGMIGLESILPKLHQFVLDQLPPITNPFDLACSCVTLLNAGAPDAEIMPYLEPLIAAQQADGAWPCCAAWYSFQRGYDGSPALTTALGLEALWKWQQRQR